VIVAKSRRQIGLPDRVLEQRAADSLRSGPPFVTIRLACSTTIQPFDTATDAREALLAIKEYGSA
jgi:hypothetical protein